MGEKTTDTRVCFESRADAISQKNPAKTLEAKRKIKVAVEENNIQNVR